MCFDLPPSAPSAPDFQVGTSPPPPPPPPHPNSLSALTFRSPGPGGAGVPGGATGPRPGVPAPRFPGRQRGAGPPGSAGLRVHSSCRGKKGGGGGEGSAKKRNRPGLSVGDTKRRTQRGLEEGRGGLPRARLIPTPARGAGEGEEECGRRIPPPGPAGEPPADRRARAGELSRCLGSSRSGGTRRTQTSEGARLSPGLAPAPQRLSAPPPSRRRRGTPRAGADHVRLPRGQETMPGGGLRQDLTSARGRARLRRRSSRLQGHLGSGGGVRPARLGGRARQPANLRPGEGGRAGDRGRSSGHTQAGPAGRAHPSSQLLTGASGLPPGHPLWPPGDRPPPTPSPTDPARSPGSTRRGRGEAPGYLKQQEAGQEEGGEGPTGEPHGWRWRGRGEGTAALRSCAPLRSRRRSEPRRRRKEAR